LTRLQPILRELDLETVLYRTDACPESRAFSISAKKKAADPDFYGVSIWGDKFYKPTDF
jgi:hypothetical protein